MLRVPRMLMIGSAGRNVGKTELACAIIRSFSRDHEVIGIKATTIEELNGECPRGGKGCGVCSSLSEDFCITEETDGPAGKDTSRMLEAGASSVLWLRCLKSHLAEGAAALLKRIGPDALCVCESNSLRRVIEPGIFVIVKGSGSDKFKASAEAVRGLAGRIVESDGKSYDLDIDRFELVNNAWTIVEKATAIVMAGGASSRMGVDKSMLDVDGRPLVQHVFNQLAPHFDEVIISANEPSQFEFLEAPIVPDIQPGQGPLMGIFSALLASSNDINVVVACDIPRISVSLIRRMIGKSNGYDAVIPVSGKGKFEPLFAVYNKSILRAMRDVLRRGARKISDVFNVAKVKYLDIEDTTCFENLNTLDDYEDFIERENDKP